MLINRVKNNKGSTLVMILIITTILMMLGTVIMSVAVSNYRMKAINSTAKRNFYFAEAGIDEAYGMIGDILDQGIIKGNEAVEVFTTGLDFDLIKKNKENDEIYDPNEVFLNEDGSLNIDELTKRQNQEFKDRFKSYIENESGLVSLITNGENYKISFEEIRPSITIDKSILTFSGDTLEFTVTSAFNYENVQKKLKAKFEIIIPDYNMPYYSETTVEILQKNVGWSKAIAAEGNLQVNRGNVAINGPVYIKGRDNTFGGISTMDASTFITFNGIVATQENIQTAASDCTIVVNGDVFADNFRIKSRDDDNNKIANSHLRVNSLDGGKGSVYTYDDLSLNGEKSTIYISNSFYGISDGSTSSEPDHSSSIVINADDIGAGSELTIINDVFIPGTSYITLFPDKYQTGESVSIKGNYRAYTYGLTAEDPKSEYGLSLLKDNVRFKYFDPLYLAYEVWDETKKNYEKLSAIDKSLYLKAYMDEKGDEHGLELGGASGINIDPAKAKHLGILVFGDQIKESNYVQEFEDERETRIAEYIKNVNFMGADDTKIEDVNGDYQVGIDDEKTVSHWVTFSRLPIKLKTPSAGDNELILLDNSNTDYAIISSGADESQLPAGVTKVYVTSDSLEKGLIISEGSIYFCGQIAFRGTVISNSDVYFLDTNNKTISYDESYVAKSIINEEIKDVFVDNYATYIEYTTDASVGFDSDSIGTDIIRDNIIRIVNWSIIK